MIVSVNEEHPEPRKIERIVQVLREGGVIAYPTDTVYGLGCDLMNKKAVERLRQIKGVADTHNFAFICCDLSDIATYAQVDNPQYRILKHHLPGPYCFVLEATREVPKLMQSKKRSVGIRVPKHPVANAICRALGTPLVSTTAQAKGAEYPEVDPFEIRDVFPGLDLVVDAGGGGMIPTTVVDLMNGSATIIREGAGSIEEFS